MNLLVVMTQCAIILEGACVSVQRTYQAEVRYWKQLSFFFCNSSSTNFITQISGPNCEPLQEIWFSEDSSIIDVMEPCVDTLYL